MLNGENLDLVGVHQVSHDVGCPDDDQLACAANATGSASAGFPT
jgi:hypothetical protein